MNSRLFAGFQFLRAHDFVADFRRLFRRWLQLRDVRLMLLIWMSKNNHLNIQRTNDKHLVLHHQRNIDRKCCSRILKTEKNTVRHSSHHSTYSLNTIQAFDYCWTGARTTHNVHRIQCIAFSLIQYIHTIIVSIYLDKMCWIFFLSSHFLLRSQHTHTQCVQMLTNWTFSFKPANVCVQV